MSFEGKRALVTGAASGLGAALCARLRSAGAEVLATDRVGGSSSAPVDLRLDVTSEADWTAARDEVQRRWSGLDLLVNNAGVAGGGRLERCDLAEWQRLVDVNLLGSVRGTRAFAPLLVQGGGRVVNVASLAGLVHPAGMGAYNAVKAAVVAFTETLGHELAASGVTAHAVCPSYFRTGLTDHLPGNDPVVEDVLRRLVDESPLSADDVAAVVLEELAAGVELIVPDEAARAAWRLKTTDRAAYDEVMRRQARRLQERV